MNYNFKARDCRGNNLLRLLVNALLLHEVAWAPVTTWMLIKIQIAKGFRNKFTLQLSETVELLTSATALRELLPQPVLLELLGEWLRYLYERHLIQFRATKSIYLAKILLNNFHHFIAVFNNLTLLLADNQAKADDAMKQEFLSLLARSWNAETPQYKGKHFECRKFRRAMKMLIKCSMLFRQQASNCVALWRVFTQ